MSTHPATSEPTLAALGEKAVIDIIRRAAPSSLNGDDAAVLYPFSPNSRTVVTTDTLVRGQHFRLDWSTPHDVGAKAVVQNFADIEAMGARPIAIVVGLSAPGDTPVSLVQGIAQGMAGELLRFATELVGGDLTQGPELVLSVTAIGSLGGAEQPLLLSRAKAGQIVVASGAIGESAAGYALLRAYGRAVPEHLTQLRDAHLRPRLHPGRGMVARALGATSGTDNSDGLSVDADAIAQQSGVRIDLDAAAISPSPLMIEAGQLLGVDPWKWVLTGGEDHTILATTNGVVPSGFRRIGTVIPGRGVTLGGGALPFFGGWTSFDK